MKKFHSLGNIKKDVILQPALIKPAMQYVGAGKIKFINQSEEKEKPMNNTFNLKTEIKIHLERSRDLLLEELDKEKELLRYCHCGLIKFKSGLCKKHYYKREYQLEQVRKIKRKGAIHDNI